MTKEEAQVAYDALIAYRRQNVLQKSRSYPGKVECHHIVPHSIGGLDIDENKILLLAKEHFMAHVYLWIIHHNDEFHDKMTYALVNMCNGSISSSRKDIRDFILMSEDYQKAKEELGKIASDRNKGENNPMSGKIWVKNNATKEQMVISKDEDIPDNWELGRFYVETDKTKTQLEKFKTINKGKIKVYNKDTNELRYIDEDVDVPNGFERRGRPSSEESKQKLKDFCEENRKKIKRRRILELRPMYEFYCKNGWKTFKEHFSYRYSQENFVQLCRRYLPEFKSMQGKRRH